MCEAEQRVLKGGLSVFLMSNRQPQMPMVAVVLLTTSLLAVVMAWVTSLYQTPTYEASIKILVGQRSAEDANPLIPLAYPDLTLTVAEVADTMPVAQAVVEQVNRPDLSAREVLANMTVEPEPGTMFIDISYKDSDPARAQLIANTIGEVS